MYESLCKQKYTIGVLIVFHNELNTSRKLNPIAAIKKVYRVYVDIYVGLIQCTRCTGSVKSYLGTT